MLLFGRSDLHEITVGETGHTFRRAPESEQFEVDVDPGSEDERVLRRYGFVPSRTAVQLTYDEQQERDEVDRKQERVLAAMSGAMAQAAATATREQMVQG